MLKEETIKLTEEGYRKNKDRLKRLESVERANVAERIRQAKEFGDISDNAEYESAKSDQAFIEGEIAQLKKLLSRAEIIDRSELTTDHVQLGSIVTIENVATKESHEITLVGTTESDVEKSLISNESPIGRALMEQKRDATVDVKTPKGLVQYKIVEIKAIA